MEQTGYVIESKNGTAKIRVDRESACGGNCVSCKGCPSSAIIINAEDKIGLKKGDVVKLYEDTKKVIKYALIGYGILAVLLVVGAVVGYIITKRDIFALLSAAIFVTIGFLIIKLCFKNVESNFTIKERLVNSTLPNVDEELGSEDE